MLLHEVEQVKLRLLQVSFVFIIFYFLSTISFSLQLHLKKPWVRGKSLRGFSLAAMTALLMSCSPSGPMAKMLPLTSLLSILFNNNLLDKSPGKEQMESNMLSISKWGNTVKDARQRESYSFLWLWADLANSTRTRWRLSPKLGRHTEKGEEEIIMRKGWNSYCNEL